MKSIAILTVAGMAAAASAHGVQEFRLFDTPAAPDNDGAQIETGGPGSSPFFMNAQGNDGDGFQEFYVMQFDLSGYSGVPVASVEIDLVQSNPFFASDGGVSIDYTADDATPFSSLSFDNSTVGGNGGQLAASDLADFQYVETADGDIDTISLADNGGFFADIESQGVIRLILEATDPFTAATYEGFDGDFGDGGPVLRITEVPAPGSVALLGLGGLAAARRRRA